MNRLAMLVTGTLLMGCGSKDGGDSAAGADGEGEDEAACAAEIGSYITPTSDETTDFYYRDSVRIQLTEDDPSATIALTDMAGTAIAGTTTLDANVLSFTPDAFLDGNTKYEAVVTTCTDSDTFTFTTSNLGGVLQEGATSLIDRTYAVALSEATFLKPAGVGSLIQSAVDVNILLGVTGADDTTLNMMGAISETGSTAQDFCNPSLAFPDADFSEQPYFQIGPADTDLSVSGFNITIVQFRISGDFSADGSYFAGGMLTGEIDARDLLQIEAVAGLGEDADALCTLVESVSSGAATCETCSTDGQEYCLTVEVINIVAEEVPNLVLELLDDCDPNRCDDC